MLVVEDVR